MDAVGEELRLVGADALLLDDLLDQDPLRARPGWSALAGSGKIPKIVASARPSVRGELVSLASSKLSQTPFSLPGNGMRRIESGTWW